MSIFGDYIYGERKKSIYKYRAPAARAIGISDVYLAQLEKGERDIPAVLFLLKISVAYGINPEKLFWIAIKSLGEDVTGDKLKKIEAEKNILEKIMETIKNTDNKIKSL